MIRRRLALIASVVLGLLATMSPAQAHEGDTVTRPAADEVVDCDSLDDVLVTFGEAVLEPQLELAGPDGARVAAETVLPTETTAVLSFESLAEPGTYEIRWFAQGTDDHPVNGTAAFVVDDNCGSSGTQRVLAVVLAAGVTGVVVGLLAWRSRRRAGVTSA